MNFPSDKKNTNIEKRGEPRSNSVFVEYSLSKENPQKISTLAKNISACGICILIVENIEINTLVFLTIHLPDETTPIYVQGKVVWAKQSSFLFTKGKAHYEAGIDYIEINTSDQARIIQNIVRSYDSPIQTYKR